MGEDCQLNKLTEELGELLQAIARYKSNPSEHTRNQLAEELADVRIMIRQVRSIAGEGVVDNYIQQKLNRQLQRMHTSN